MADADDGVEHLRDALFEIIGHRLVDITEPSPTSADGWEFYLHFDNHHTLTVRLTLDGSLTLSEP